MHVVILGQTYRSFGAHKVTHELAERIGRHLPRRAFGLAELTFVALSEIHESSRPALDLLHQEFSARLAKLPTSQYEKKNENLRLKFKTRLDLRAPHSSDANSYNLTILFDDVISTLEQLEPKLAKKPGLDFKAFLQSLRSNRQKICFGIGNLRDARSNSWEGLEIDWAEYHDHAKRLLDDPIFWRDPVGDSKFWGAAFKVDVEFKRWRNRHASDDAMGFVNLFFRQGGDVLRLRQFLATDSAAYEKRDGDIARVYCVLAIGAALAQLKLEANCDSELRRAAAFALELWQRREVHDLLGWVMPERTMETAQALQGKLD